MKTAYSIFGKGEAIVFIHGIGSRKSTWNGIIKELKDKYKCISYDLRGHGDSFKDENDFTMEDLVKDLERLLNHLNIDKLRNKILLKVLPLKVWKL